MAGAVTFLQRTSFATNETDYSFAAQNLGAEAADRYIIVVAHARDSLTNAKSLVSITVAGVAAAIVDQLQASSTQSALTAIAIAHVPTGTSGDIDVAWSEVVVSCAIGVFHAVGINPAASATAKQAAADPSVTLDIPAGGIAVGGGNTGSADTATWVGLTERYDAIVESVSGHTGACDDFASLQTALPISITFTGSSAETVGVFASWGSAGAGGMLRYPKRMDGGMSSMRGGMV